MMYVCKYCGAEIENDEESLWGHIQLNHEEVFAECQNWETPDMLEECYDECIPEETLKKCSYELYKVDWIGSQIKPEQLLAEYRTYLFEKEENWDYGEDFSFEDYLFEFGFSGSIYVCFEEFLGAEFLDAEYMKSLLTEDSAFWRAYMKLMNPEEEADDAEDGEKTDPDDYTIEYCPFCDSEQVIFAKGITACPECGKPLAPCSMCEECDYSTCPYGCTGGEKDEHLEVTNPPISKEMAEALYKLL